jgi:hypothetical protein
VHDAGVRFDLEHALAIERAVQPCRWAEVNAALMLHDGNVSLAEVHAYLRRWAMVGDKLADHLIRFMTEPTSRTYVVNYPAGHELCQSYVAGQPERFRRLLTEQVRVCDLLDAQGGGVGPADRADAAWSDQDALSFVPAAGSAEPHDHCGQCAGGHSPAGERCIARR